LPISNSQARNINRLIFFGNMLATATGIFALSMLV
jgi:hypothetical protein